MAEDQSINGDRWTSEAGRLLVKAGWKKIADSNIDIEGSDGLKHGIDSIFSYTDGFYANKRQGVFLEAKRYAITSFSKNKMSDWFLRLDEKIRSIRLSEKFYSTYPLCEDLNLINGLLVIWFHDLQNYSSFKQKFIEYLRSSNIPRGRNKSQVNVRLFVMDNEKILQTASLIATAEKWKSDNTSISNSAEFNFYYPSSAGYGNPVQELTCLNIEYLFSQFILAKGKVTNAKNVEIYDIAFYFGKLTINGFLHLLDILLARDMINRQNNLIIYTYQRDHDSFRKIRPIVIEMFEQVSPKSIEIVDMDIFADLPSWMTK